MSEPFSGAGEALRATITGEIAGGKISITIGSNNVQAVRDVCIAAVSLGALYVGYQLIARKIDSAVKKALGGERDDQGDPDIKPGSLHVLLHCYTDKRFLEVLRDCKSGRMKKCLQKEFSQVGIEVEGLKVEIENVEEVIETKEAINNRYDRCLIKNFANSLQSPVHSNLTRMQYSVLKSDTAS